jgi:hypothetical protein
MTPSSLSAIGLLARKSNGVTLSSFGREELGTFCFFGGILATS